MNLLEISNTLADGVESAGRSVVRVNGRTRRVSGTVFSPEGHIVAISHTIDHDDVVEVGLDDGRAARAKVLGRDAATDLALLQAEATGLEPAVWGNLDGARVGQILVGVYRPGLKPRATFGILGALGDAWRTRFGGRIDRYVEASLPLHPGFSGGVLIDAGGRALALSTSGLVRGVALGIPATTVKRVAESLLAHGRVRHGYIGVGTRPVALPPSLQASLGQPTGLLLLSVEAQSPAAEAGLLLGDVIVSLDGRSVTEPADLLPALDEDRVGHDAALRILRAGELREVRVRIGERKEAA